MAVESIQENELSLTVLKQQLAECVRQGLENGDPLRFFYLQALLENLTDRQHLTESAFQGLIGKAARLMSDYQQTFTARTDQAENHSVTQTRAASGLSKLKALNLQLQQRTGAGRSGVKTSAQQDEPLRADELPTPELHALKHYQKLFEKMAVERLLSKVMQEIPENAGPLNPERVVIRCLSSLQEISPAYVMRLMGYYESLISLQSLPLNEK